VRRVQVDQLDQGSIGDSLFGRMEQSTRCAGQDVAAKPEHLVAEMVFRFTERYCAGCSCAVEPMAGYLSLTHVTAFEPLPISSRASVKSTYSYH
jgi:hypothetical protein